MQVLPAWQVAAQLPDAHCMSQLPHPAGHTHGAPLQAWVQHWFASEQLSQLGEQLPPLLDDAATVELEAATELALVVVPELALVVVAPPAPPLPPIPVVEAPLLADVAPPVPVDAELPTPELVDGPLEKLTSELLQATATRAPRTVTTSAAVWRGFMDEDVSFEPARGRRAFPLAS